ncbi:MAG TPA: hypothetical protein VJB98_03560 [Candidatus Paceibacterota bacterium]
MKSLTCPECKNEVDLSAYGELTVGQIVECDHCGITLALTDVSNNELQAEIADEGK